MLDTYATSYYNDAYFWPGLKVHWRRKDNSPLTGFSQGRVIGGGSSVMGMVAYRGSPDDYAEWEASGAKGWGWNDVLPFYRKLEHDMDFGGDAARQGRPGADPPHQAGGLGAAVEGRACLRAGAPDPVHRRHEHGLPRRLRRGADEQLAGQARLGGDLLSRRRDARAHRTSRSSTARTPPGLHIRRQARDRRHRPDRRRGEAILRARNHPLDGRHPLAGVSAAHGHRAGAASARTGRRGARRPAGRRREPVEPRHRVRRPPAEPRRTAAGMAASASDDGVPLFVRPAGRAAARHVHQRAVQDLVEPARLPGREPRPDPAQADGARPRLAARRRRAAAGRVQLHRPRARPASASCRASGARSTCWRTRRCAP